MTAELVEFRDAIKLAIAGEMERDERVIFFGEDVAAAGGVFKVTEGLMEQFGDSRVFDTPISELALAGAAFGSAATGLRPIIEIMFGDFMALPMDSLVNQAAKYRYLSFDRQRVPLVVRTAVGAGGRFGAVHSQNPGTWLHGIPGLKVIAPSDPSSAKALLTAAIRDDDPVVLLEHKRLYSVKAPLDDTVMELGKAAVVRPGSDVTIVSVMTGVASSLAASEQLSEHGIEAEVIDLRSLRPLDVATVVDSVATTGRLVVVEEGPQTGGWAAGLAGAIATTALDLLEDVMLINTPDAPIPFSPPLEDAFLPTPERIVQAITERFVTA